MALGFRGAGAPPASVAGGGSEPKAGTNSLRTGFGCLGQDGQGSREKETKGQANPQVLNDLVKKMLSE